jgi:hypothetical protein
VSGEKAWKTRPGRGHRMFTSSVPPEGTLDLEETPRNVVLGRQLFGYSVRYPTRLRSEKGGRQSLQQFAKEDHTHQNEPYPAEWDSNPDIPLEEFKYWLNSPENAHRQRNITLDPLLEPQANGMHPQSTAQRGASTPNALINRGYIASRNRTQSINQSEVVTSLKVTIENQSAQLGKITEMLITVMNQNKDLKSNNEELKHQYQEFGAQYREFEARYRELKAQNEELKTQMEEIKTQGKETQQRCESLEKMLATGISSIEAVSRSPTWASIASLTGASQASRPDSTSPNTSAGNEARTTDPQANSNGKAPGIDVDLTPINNPQFDINNITEIRKRVRAAFDSHPVTKNIGKIAIAMKGNNQTTMRICTRTRDDARIARIHKEWMESHFRGARMLNEQWYPVRIDRVNKSSICDESNVKFSNDARAIISLENKVTVSRVRFLRRPTPDQSHCSIVIDLDDEQEAEMLIEQRYMEFGGEAGYTRKFYATPTPNRCYKCQKLTRHRAMRCPERESTCGHCAQVGHTHDACTADTPRCVNCNGPHPSNDRGCPEYKKQLAALEPNQA